jgi:hypothetical protein
VSPIDARSLLPIARTVSEPMCKKLQGAPDWRPYPSLIRAASHTNQTGASAVYKSASGSWLTLLTISYTHITAYKKQWAPDRRSIQFLLISARATPHIKVRGSRSTLHITSIIFSTRITTYKKQAAPDRHSIQLLLLSAHASLCTKSKELHMYVLHI